MNALEAGMAPEHPALDALYPLALDADEPQPHLQQHVLHRKVGGHAAHHDRLLFAVLALAPGSLGRQEVERARFVQCDVRGRDPLAFAVVFVGGVVVDWCVFLCWFCRCVFGGV